MTDFEIDIRPSPASEPGGPAGIAVRAGSLALTRLIRPHEREPDDYLLAPPAQLAFWLVDNWWRIRWECIPPAGMTAEWRLAHEMSSIGGGYVWPRLAIWGEGGRVGLLSYSDPVGVVGPVRYLTDALLFVDASEFETETDKFLSDVIDAQTGSDTDRSALRTQVCALRSEQENPGTAAWRRMEARLGFDPDEAPQTTIDSLGTLAERYGDAGVEEAAMAMPGANAAAVLEAEIDAAKVSRVECSFDTALAALHVPVHGASAPGDGILEGNEVFPLIAFNGSPPRSTPSVDHPQVPWQFAEEASVALRRGLGLGPGPLRNKMLAQVLGTSADHFRPTAGQAPNQVPYGLRLNASGSDRHRVVVRSRWSHDRRFELVRALGDAIWSDGDRLGPLAASKSARQKFQRAFAQSLLCPYNDLIGYIGTEHPADEDISAAAQHFHVSERVIRTVLVNKGVLGRHRLERLVRDELPSQLDELVEAT